MMDMFSLFGCIMNIRIEDKIMEERLRWFKDARLGMFIHFGAYCVPARGEWVKTNEEMSDEQYQVYIDAFHPQCDMKQWARLAKEAGMKYAIFTSKHHDGYCLFDTKTTDYKYEKDLVKEFMEAFKTEGLKVGLYYSVIDWHHIDYPHYQDRHHPQRNDIKWKDYKHDFDVYLDYMHEQVRELCTNYGTLDILWFDFSYDDMTGEMWRGSELVSMVKTLHPNIILNNRLEVSGEGFGSVMTNHPLPYSGDVVSPEQIIPPLGLIKEDGTDATWEACVTMNDNWGYTVLDHNYKDAKTLIRKLVECVSKGGNMLLNIGPDANGDIPLPQIKLLEEIGEWMKLNHESIYGCGKSQLLKPENGRITQHDNKIYYHILENDIGDIPLYGIKKEDIVDVKWLKTNAKAKISDSWIVSNYPDIVFIERKDAKLLDDIDTVIEVIVK